MMLWVRFLELFSRLLCVAEKLLNQKPLVANMGMIEQASAVPGFPLTIFDGICFRSQIEFKLCFLMKMIRGPLAGSPPRRGGMLSDVRPLSRHKPQHMPAGMLTNKDFNYPCGLHTQVGGILCATGYHQQLFIPGRPPGPTQSGWSVGSTNATIRPSFNSAGIGAHAATYMLITALAHSFL